MELSWWRFLALPAPGNGGAGNGTHSTAAQLFRIWKSPYFDFDIYTCIIRFKWKQRVKRNGFISPVVAVLAIFGPKAGKTETPNNGICTIIASSVCVKVPSCSWLKLLIPIWTLIGYKQPERGRFISLRTTILAVCALPAPGNGGAGNGTHSTAAQLFRIWKSPYFDFDIYTCIIRFKWKQRVKRNGFISPVVAVLAIFGPKAGKTETPNNTIYMHFRGLKALRRLYKARN